MWWRMRFIFPRSIKCILRAGDPGAPVMFNPVTNSVIVADSFAAHGLIVGRIKDGVWQWGA